jgi:hypothetical protein
MEPDEFLEGPAKQANDSISNTTVKDEETTLINYLVEMKDFENHVSPKKGDAFANAFLADTKLKLHLMLFSCDIGTRDRKGRIGSQNGPKHFIE